MTCSVQNQIDVQSFMKEKKQGFLERPRKSIIVKPNGRSADFIMPNFAIGCDLGCTYCHISRHREFGNPVELYTNLEDIWDATYKHWAALPRKTTPNQCDSTYWTYDIGEGTDCLAPSTAERTRWFLKRFLLDSYAKPTFATKIPNSHQLLALPSHLTNRARVRVSLMPQRVADVVEVGTMQIAKRIRAIDEILDMNYEVHVNFSPVIAYNGWYRDYIQLFQDIDKTISNKAKKQLKCEVIFLTHHAKLHELNLTWNPNAERLLWAPSWQEEKVNERGDKHVLRYKYEIKSKLVSTFKAIVAEHLPYCEIRYIF